MIEHPAVIPVTAAVAVTIFLLKEIFEFLRRFKADRRKLRAIKRFLAVECERNNAAIGGLKARLQDIARANPEMDSFRLVIEPDGSQHIVHEHGGGSWGSSALRQIHTDALSKFMFDAASLDGRLFEICESASDALLEVRHVRSSLVNFTTTTFKPRAGDVFGLAEWALTEIDDHLQAVRDLYFYCTANPLESARLR